MQSLADGADSAKHGVTLYSKDAFTVIFEWLSIALEDLLCVGGILRSIEALYILRRMIELGVIFKDKKETW